MAAAEVEFTTNSIWVCIRCGWLHINSNLKVKSVRAQTMALPKFDLFSWHRRQSEHLSNLNEVTRCQKIWYSITQHSSTQPSPLVVHVISIQFKFSSNHSSEPNAFAAPGCEWICVEDILFPFLEPNNRRDKRRRRTYSEHRGLSRAQERHRNIYIYLCIWLISWPINTNKRFYCYESHANGVSHTLNAHKHWSTLCGFVLLFYNFKIIASACTVF